MAYDFKRELEVGCNTVVWLWYVLNENWGPIHRRLWGPVWVMISTCLKNKELINGALHGLGHQTAQNYTLRPCMCYDFKRELEFGCKTVGWLWYVLKENWGPIHSRRWGPVWVMISTCSKIMHLTMISNISNILLGHQMINSKEACHVSYKADRILKEALKKLPSGALIA